MAPHGPLHAASAALLSPMLHKLWSAAAGRSDSGGALRPSQLSSALLHVRSMPITPPMALSPFVAECADALISN